jgi:hypothetical protein
MTKTDDKNLKPAPTPKPGEAEVVANLGVLRVETAEEVQQNKENSGQPVAPYDGDPREAHERVVMQANRAALSTSNAFDALNLPAVGMPPALDDKGRAAPEELYPVRLLFDWWDGQGLRHPKDDIVEIPLNEAKKLMDEGKGEYAGKMTPVKG